MHWIAGYFFSHCITKERGNHLLFPLTPLSRTASTNKTESRGWAQRELRAGGRQRDTGGPQVNGKVSTQKNKLKGKTGKFGKCSEREERRTYGLKSLAQEGEGKTDEYICAVIIVTINAVKLPFTAGRRRMKWQKRQQEMELWKIHAV